MQTEEGRWRVEFDEPWAREGAKPPEGDDPRSPPRPPRAAQSEAVLVTKRGCFARGWPRDRPGVPGPWSVSKPDATNRPPTRTAARKRAAGQWGVLSLDQLRACGSDKARSRCGCGGPPPPPLPGCLRRGPQNIPQEGHFLAAVKACGPYAVL